VKEPNSAKSDNLDSFLGDLQRELSVTPSPDFAARVRARVERDTSRAWSPARWFFGAFVVASAAVVVIMFWNRPAPEPVRPVSAVAAHQPAPAALTSTPPSVAAASPSSPTSVRSRPARRASPARATLRATSQGPVAAELVNGDPMTVDPTTASPAIRTLEVLVPPDQEIALRRLLLGMRSGGAGAPPGSSPSAVDPLPDVPSIVIVPIRIDALPGSVNVGGRR
jgi:hypothetical protein